MKPNEKNDFDRQLKEKFDGFRPEVPRGLWDKIAMQLDAKQQPPLIPISKKKRRFPRGWLSVAALLLMGIGIAYWYNRPVPVTYLKRAATAEDPVPVEAIAVDKPDEAPVPDPIALDVERLKRLFAKKDRKGSYASGKSLTDKGAPVVDNSEGVAAVHQQFAEKDTRQAIQEREAAAPLPKSSIDASVITNEALAAVPDIEPLIPDEEEESLLASTHDAKPAFGISTILNYVVGTVDQREDKLVTFSNDSEGSLKLDFNFGLARNKKKKLK